MIGVSDKTFGAGTSVEVLYLNGNRETVALYPEVPFVVFGLTLHNGGKEPVVLNHVPTISAKVDLGLTPVRMKTLGTGGLLLPQDNTGSYVFLAVADPENRRGIVGGWLTHDRGSGVVFSPIKDGEVRLNAQLDYGRLLIQPGADAEAEKFALGYFDDVRAGLETYADEIARVYKIKLPKQPSGFCTWYTEKFARASDEVHLAELSAQAGRDLKPFGFDFVQIDDGWQLGENPRKNGPRKNFTAHDPKGAYPSGMKSIADKIKADGLQPGIWFLPFAGTWDDSYFAEHQDWFAKGPDGKPYDTAWGGTCLDMTNAGAREHLRKIVQRIAHEWGYTVFKMDGFWTGSATKQVYVNNEYRDDKMGETTFSDPNVTNVEALRSGVKLIRETAGPGVYLLGCCVSQNMRSFGGSFGLLDGMRIGPDTSGRIGAIQGSRLWFLNGRVWHNDPDCVYVRKQIPVEEARLNASWAAIAGQLFYDSDWMPDLPSDRLDILKRCMPAHGLFSRPVDVLEKQPARLWLLTDSRGTVRRDVVALYNWVSGNACVTYPLAKIGLPPAAEYVGFDFWANKFVPPFKDQIRADFSGEGCRILSIRPVSAVPQLISTSLHLTQGMVDVLDEKWYPATKTLSGISHLVGNDSYELRVVVPAGIKSWMAKSVEVSMADVDSKVTATVRQDGPRIRARIESPSARDVHWQMRFEESPVNPGTPKPIANLKAQPVYHFVKLEWEESGADSYRITRNDGVTYEVHEPGFVDSSVDHGKKYQYTVSTVAWDGSASSPATVETQTPDVLAPPSTEKPDIYLGDLQPVSVKLDRGKLSVDKNFGGKPLILNRKTYARGIGLYANAEVKYAIPAGATRFVAQVGIDDSQLSIPEASVVFQVYGDVKEMGEPPVLLGKSPELSSKTIRNWAFNVEINSRYKELKIVVLGAGAGNKGDMADLVDAGFLKK